MAKKDEVEKLRQKSRITALEGLRKQPGFPVRPGKAMSIARKKSKGRGYPPAPYPANPLLLYQWARGEWESLGKWKMLALPVIIIVALTTWEKEFMLREARWDQIEHEQAAELAQKLYLKESGVPEKKRFPLSLFSRKNT